MFLYGYYGKFLGTYYPAEQNKTGEMLILQFKAYQDLDKRLEIAKEILNSATHNMLFVLKNYKNIVNEEIIYIKKLRKTFEKQRNIPALMAIEGNVRKAYYGALGKIVGEKDFNFEERKKTSTKR